MKKSNLLFTTIAMVVLLTTIVSAGEISVSETNAANLGFVTLAPPLIAITLAFITKNVVISLFLGCMSGTYIIALTNSADSNGFLEILFNIFKNLIVSFVDFTNRVLESLADPWNAGIILQVLAIGGVVHLISKMGGARAIAEKLVTKAKTPRSAQIITLLLGLIVFFDDYANSLIVGPIMRPVYDKMKISREKLAFVVDATAAPIAGIAIISTWIGYEVGLIQKAYANLDGLTQSVNGFNIFVQTIPYRFYNIFMLSFVVIIALSSRDFGPMLKAEQRTKSGDKGVENPSFDEDEYKDSTVKPRMVNAIVPILALVVSAVLSFYYTGYLAIIGSEVVEDIAVVTSGLSLNSILLCFGSADAAISLFQSAVFASIVAITMAVGQGIFKLDEAITSWIDGMKALLITGVILLLAWSLKSVSDELGTAYYLIALIGDAIPKFILPSIIFLIGSCISFATGTSYGTMGILMPLAVPLGWAIGGQDLGYTILSTSAVLTGAIFGDHCSPISDTTILSSMGSSCHHINHVNTQIPYAVFVGLITIVFGYIPAALGLSVFIIIPVSILVMVFGMRILGKENVTTNV